MGAIRGVGVVHARGARIRDNRKDRDINRDRNMNVNVNADADADAVALREAIEVGLFMGKIFVFVWRCGWRSGRRDYG